MTRSHDYFRQIADDYDSVAQRAMPWCDEMLAELVRCLPDDARSVLELGCGTGRLTALLADRYPGAVITAVDAAEEMVEVARTRVGTSSGGDRLSFLLSTFEEFDAGAGSYDVIAANWSLHHVVDKPPFYARLQKMLAPGGYLAVGDEFIAEPPELQARNEDEWLALARRPGRLTEAELADIRRHDEQFDHNVSLRTQMAILEDAGFDPVDGTWRYRNSAVVVGRAPQANGAA